MHPSNLLMRTLQLIAILALILSLVPAPVSAEPPQQGGGIVYFVRPGDTLFWISQRFGTTVPAIMSANGLASDYIQAGQRLIIPVGYYPYYPYGSSIFAPQPLPPITPQASPTFTCSYAVRPGDTVYSIAYRYRVTVISLMQANGLYSPLIFVNQSVKVPCNNPTPDAFATYTVATGDNLLRIAVKYSTSIYALQLVNGIPNPHVIFAGQSLVIPYPGSYVWQNVPPPPNQNVTHVVISQFRTRGPNQGNDEFIEIYNPTSAIVNVSGWLIKASNSNAFVETRFTFPANTQLNPGQHYLIGNNSAQGYSGSVAADQSYSTSITDDGGIALALPDGTVIDQVGMSNGSAFKEGTVLAPLTTNEDRAYERKLGGSNGNCIDGNNNVADFTVIAPSTPRDLASAAIICAAAATPTPGGPTLTPTATATGSVTPTGGTAISIQNNSFIPSTLTVAVGTTVTWKNNDLITHTVKSGNPGAPASPLQSGPLNSTATYQFTFQAAGVYPFFCEIHGVAMTGSITVQ